jgi:CheY-like chemotaxis protein
MNDASQVERTLVVEDYADSADTFAALLRTHGFEVIVARDGLEALELSDRIKPSLVFLDIGLPKVNGYDVCRHIRSTQWGRHAAVIAVTGYGQTSDVKIAIEAGFDVHLLKPVKNEDLLKAIQRALASNQVPRN